MALTRKTPEHDENQAFTDLMREHQGPLRGYVLSMMGGDHAATDDVLQETNLVLFKKADQFEVGTSFMAWASRVAFFEVMRARRQMSRDRLVLDDGLLDLVAAEAEVQGDRYEAKSKALAFCLRKLGERQRAMVLKRYYHGRTVAELAAETGQRANAVSQLLFRARQALMACVEGYRGRAQG
ncbi:MAG: sigma-70 family RNA polymerase sigma factor [Verrucomicrobiota bacterium]